MMWNMNIWIHRITRRRPVPVVNDDGNDKSELGRSLSLLQLMLLGVGATIGTGIFFALAETVPKAGSGVIISFLLAGVVAGLTALCYAEIASSVPISGSSYSYAYVTMGEGVAFMIAGCLILEYGIATGAVAIGWAGYLNEALHILFQGAFDLPPEFRQGPLVVILNAEGELNFSFSGAYMNVPAFFLVWMCALLLMRGARESVLVNSIMVLMKLMLLFIFIVIAASSFDQVNLSPFLPNGMQGVTAAAGTIFFSYIGLDAVVTASEEVKNPRRNIPIAIIGALLIVTSVYIGVAISALGAQPVADFSGQEAGLAEILRKVTGTELWPLIMAIGAVISVFSITLVTLYGQTRILFAVSRDGLLPAVFHKVNPRNLSPNFNVFVVATVVSLLSGFAPASLLWDLVSIGTLVAFTTVSAALIILRRKKPDLQRSYSVPFYPYLPIASILACVYVILNLNSMVWTLFLSWLLLGGLYYIVYAARRSTLESK